jgi:hypothetical protein
MQRPRWEKKKIMNKGGGGETISALDVTLWHTAHGGDWKRFKTERAHCSTSPAAARAIIGAWLIVVSLTPS